jgi:hypothetical protein
MSHQVRWIWRLGQHGYSGAHWRFFVRNMVLVIFCQWEISAFQVDLKSLPQEVENLEEIPQTKCRNIISDLLYWEFLKFQPT